MRYATILAAVGGLSVLAGAAMASPMVIDDGEAGASQQGDFYSASYAPTPGKAYNDDFCWTQPNATGTNAYYSWQFTSLTAGEYDVYITWPADKGLAPYWSPGNTASPFSVINGGVLSRGWPDWNITPDAGATTLANLSVNQSVNAAGYSYAGLSWFALGRYTITGDKLSVILTNNTTGTGSVVADAVMIAPVPEPAMMGVLGAGALLVLRRRR